MWTSYLQRRKRRNPNGTWRRCANIFRDCHYSKQGYELETHDTMAFWFNKFDILHTTPMDIPLPLDAHSYSLLLLNPTAFSGANAKLPGMWTSKRNSKTLPILWLLHRWYSMSDILLGAVNDNSFPARNCCCCKESSCHSLNQKFHYITSIRCFHEEYRLYSPTKLRPWYYVSSIIYPSGQGRKNDNLVRHSCNIKRTPVPCSVGWLVRE